MVSHKNNKQVNDNVSQRDLKLLQLKERIYFKKKEVTIKKRSFKPISSNSKKRL